MRQTIKWSLAIGAVWGGVVACGYLLKVVHWGWLHTPFPLLIESGRVIGAGVGLGLAVGLLVGAMAGLVPLVTQRLSQVAPSRPAYWAAGALVLAGCFVLVSRALGGEVGRPGVAGRLVAAGAAIIAAYVVVRIVAGVVAALSRRGTERGTARGIVVALGSLLVIWVSLSFVAPDPRAQIDSDAVRLAAAAAAGDARPNVVLISVDTLRPDFVGYNAGPVRTPSIDALAAQSHIFESAYSVAPWTRPSFAAFFSGRYPSEMGVGRVRGRDWRPGSDLIPPVWRDEPVLLAEALKSAGYATLAVVTNVSLTPEMRADQGFDFFHHCSVRPPYHPDLLSRAAPSRLPPLRDWCARQRNELQRADVLSRLALEMVPAIDGQPVLLWFHYLDPHSPYDPPTLPPGQRVTPRVTHAQAGIHAGSSSERARFVAAYTEEVNYCDEWLGKLVDGLKARGLWDSSIIVFWSDHGEEFWEHGGWGHGQSLHNELLEVPLLIHMPGQGSAVRVAQPVSLLDVMPTLLGLCEAKRPPHLRGRSLRPVLESDAGSLPPLNVYLEACHRGSIRKGLLTDDYKLVYDVYLDQFSLYDYRNDPSEKHDLYGTGDAPDTTAWETELLKWTEDSLAAMDYHVKPGSWRTSPEARQQLKDMGYTQ